MATNFPTSLDTFTNPNSGNTLDSPSHSVQHSDINDAVEAIEAKIGVGSSTAGSATAGYALVNTSGGTTAYSLLGVAGLTSGTADANTVLTANGSGGATFASTAQGLTLINTTSFSAVVSQAFDSVFSATYDNYYITVTMTTTSSPTLTMVMRTGAVDNTNSNYNFQRLEVSNTGVTGTRTAAGASWAIDTQTDSPKVFTMEMLNPFTSTTNTFLKSFAFPAGYWQLGGARFSANTSFDGFKIICSTGNMTGTAKIYALAN